MAFRPSQASTTLQLTDNWPDLNNTDPLTSDTWHLTTNLQHGKEWYIQALRNSGPKLWCLGIQNLHFCPVEGPAGDAFRQWPWTNNWPEQQDLEGLEIKGWCYRWIIGERSWWRTTNSYLWIGDWVRMYKIRHTHTDEKCNTYLWIATHQDISGTVCHKWLFFKVWCVWSVSFIKNGLWVDNVTCGSNGAETQKPFAFHLLRYDTAELWETGGVVECRLQKLRKEIGVFHYVG